MLFNDTAGVDESGSDDDQADLTDLIEADDADAGDGDLALLIGDGPDDDNDAASIEDETATGPANENDETSVDEVIAAE